ncbi:MAG: STAS domain-containing protein [Streptosporangiaceae bacterium]|nr:STAS domain-containing protein [Streptosporangiaceae bacterium]
MADDNSKRRAAAVPDYLRIGVEERGPIRVLTATGDLDCFTVSEFMRQITAIRKLPAGRIVVDLSGLRFVDCAGIRALASARRAAETDSRVILRSIRPAVRRALQVLGVELEPPPPVRPSAIAESPIMSEVRRVIEDSRGLARSLAATEERVAGTFSWLAECRPQRDTARLLGLSDAATRQAARLRRLAGLTCPVLPAEAYDSAELGRVRRDHCQSAPECLACDQHVISADRSPALLQGRAHLPCDPGILVIKVQQVQITGKQDT